KEIKKIIIDETSLTCSIGIAPNKLLAKMASDMQKPDGITIIREGDLENRIWPLPVGRLLGVGPKTEQSLKEMGIETIGDLAAVPLDKLVEKFGKSQRRYLYEASRGIDESPLIIHRKIKSVRKENI
ncbi:MAG: DNA polymerase IV, partial [Candidatus Brocadia sinica]|nr:DNA polymerase IV [Candidatus Brocadia sinica]